LIEAAEEHSEVLPDPGATFRVGQRVGIGWTGDWCGAEHFLLEAGKIFFATLEDAGLSFVAQRVV